MVTWELRALFDRPTYQFGAVSVIAPFFLCDVARGGAASTLTPFVWPLVRRGALAGCTLLSPSCECAWRLVAPLALATAWRTHGIDCGRAAVAAKSPSFRPSWIAEQKTFVLVAPMRF